MKHLVYLIVPAMMLAACGGGSTNKADELAKLKKERGELDAKIKTLEAGKKDTTQAIPVGVTEVQPIDFHGFVEVQSAITGDENVLAVPQAQGTVKSVNVHVGQQVSKGQVLAYLDATVVEQQISAQEIELDAKKTMYEKTQKLWDQNIGKEIDLIQAKAAYEGALKGMAATRSQRDMYRILSPISGVVDAITIKVGDYGSPSGAQGGLGIRVVSYAKLKAQANLGENYLGKVKQGDKVLLVLPDIKDTIKTALTYVGQAVDPLSRAFTVEVILPNNNKLHPNMSCVMKILNYENKAALVVPVSVIQHTSQGTLLYVADGNKAKAVVVTEGRNANGMVEILSGLNAGDKVITTGFEELDNGQGISIQ